MLKLNGQKIGIHFEPSRDIGSCTKRHAVLSIYRLAISCAAAFRAALLWLYISGDGVVVFDIWNHHPVAQGGTTKDGVPKDMQAAMMYWTVAADNYRASGLQSMTFGNCINQSMDNSALPNGLQNLTAGMQLTQSMGNTALPSGLWSLTCRLYIDALL